MLTVLVFAAVQLAGPHRRFSEIDAFAGLPTGGLLTPQPPTAGTLPRLPTQLPGGGPPGLGGAPVGTDGVTGPASPTGAAGGQGQPGQGNGGPGGRPPSVTTVPPANGPPVEPEQLLAATQQFFAALPEDVPAAWQMMSRPPAYEEFDRQWRRFSDVQLQEVVIDADEAIVTASVLVVSQSGRTAVQQWRLTYERDETLLIKDATLLDNGGLDDEEEPADKPAR